MTIQVLKNVTLPNGMTVKAGGVLNVPDHVGAALVQQGLARLRTRPGPTETKDTLPPPAVPYTRVPAPPQSAASFVTGAYEDQDNFVRDLVTITPPIDWPWWGNLDTTPAPPVAPSPSASGRDPVLTLDQIKLHCHIELDQTDEDALLLDYEMAARLNTENYLRYQIDASVGENIKQACLTLIAHWYRNREAVSTGRGSAGAEMPMAYKHLLNMERDYPVY